MSIWTDENTARALELYVKGDSASEIAKALGRGFTRNAVIGKIHRSGKLDPNRQRVERENSNLTRKVAANLSRALKPLPAPKPPPTQPPQPLALLELGFSSCRWPINVWALGEGETARFCGQRKDFDSPYCSKCRTRSVAHVQPHGRIRAP